MTITYYYFSIGSNIEPESHIPASIDAFAGVFGGVTLGRLFLTEPVGVETDHQFLNACFAVGVETNYPLSRAWCDGLCKVIEIQHGRPIDQPGRSHISRTVDIDYLFNSEDSVQAELAELPVYSALDLERLYQTLETDGVPDHGGAADRLVAEGSVRLYQDIQPGHFTQHADIRFLW